MCKRLLRMCNPARFIGLHPATMGVLTKVSAMAGQTGKAAAHTATALALPMALIGAGHAISGKQRACMVLTAILTATASETSGTAMWMATAFATVLTAFRPIHTAGSWVTLRGDGGLGLVVAALRQISAVEGYGK
jgi:hypothetical protein